MTCSLPYCDREARMAINTNRPTRDTLYSTVYYDDRDPKAPKKAVRYCKKHGAQTIADLVDTLVEDDKS